MKLSELKHEIGGGEVASVILAFVLGVERSQLFPHVELDATQINRARRIAREHARGVPIQYCLGWWHFMEMPFHLTRHVLIPRHDSEILVTKALEYTNPSSTVLDMCAGSGCIGIAVAKLGKIASLTGADICPYAIKVATFNAEVNKVPAKFVVSDMFASITGTFDVIVTNPPYIETERVGYEDPATLDEPSIAFDGGHDGLDFYHILARDAAKHLNPSGVMLMEIDRDQGKDIHQIFTAAGWQILDTVKDLAGRDRVVVVRR